MGRRPNREIPVWAPSMADDPQLRAWFARLHELQAASPGKAREPLGGRRHSTCTAAAADPRAHARDAPPETRLDIAPRPLHRRAHPGRPLVELQGSDHLDFLGDTDAILDEIEEFLTGGRAGASRIARCSQSCSPTSSTRRLAPRARRRPLARPLDAHDEHGTPPAAPIHGARGQDHGDGFLATFDGPPSARCVRAAIARGRARARHRGPRRPAHRRVSS